MLHDAAYSEVGYDGYQAGSFLQVDGSKDIGIEFHSLSKTYNMTGWRIGMAVGNADMIKALFQVKANLDSGVPQAVQEMAMEALTGPQDCVSDNVEIYQRRRDRVVSAVRSLGMEVAVPRASLYIWARVPEGVHLSRTGPDAAGGVGCRRDPRLQLRPVRRRLHPGFPLPPLTSRSKRAASAWNPGTSRPGEAEPIAKRSVMVEPEPERAVLVAVELTRRGQLWALDDTLAELEYLANTAGAQVVGPG